MHWNGGGGDPPLALHFSLYYSLLLLFLEHSTSVIDTHRSKWATPNVPEAKRKQCRDTAYSRDSNIDANVHARMYGRAS